MVDKASDTYYETICNNHNQVIFDLQQLRNSNNLTKEQKQLLLEAINTIKFCKKQGQHMENRMSKYRKAIEDLGFIRTGGR